MKNHIVIPLHHKGGKFGDDSELRICLRALERHFKSDYDVSIVCHELPDWVIGVTHIRTPRKNGIKTALHLAALEYPQGFFWLYDDCCLLRDMTDEEMKVTPCSSRLKGGKGKWGEGLEVIAKRLSSEGIDAWDYSRPHGPYWFDKGMIDEAFGDWGRMKGKFPFESWILSKRDWPRRKGVVRQFYGAFSGPIDIGRWWFLNYSCKGTTRGLMRYLQEMFPLRSRFEDGSEMRSFAVQRGDRHIFTCHEGCDRRIWDWCGDGIKVFAFSHGASLTQLPKSTHPNPQWVFFDAVKESLKHGKEDIFAWIDSDVVVSHPATDIWDEYPRGLRLTHNKVRKDIDFYSQHNLPHELPNICTGVVKWSYEDALTISKWVDENIHLFDVSTGDQEILIKCLYDTGLSCAYFHPKMQVTGPNPPASTAFKHRGGPTKVHHIPKFIEVNKRQGIHPSDELIAQAKEHTK